MASEEDLSTSLDSVLARTLTDSNASAASTPQDAVMLALHASLLSAGYVCVAIGDEGFGGEAIRTSEAVSTPQNPQLPIGWNASQEVCSLQYRHASTRRICLVKAVSLGTQLLISAVVSSQMERVFSLTIKPLKYVQEGSTYNSPKNLLELMSTLKGEIEVKLSQECKQSPGAALGAAAIDPVGPGDPDPVGPGDPDPVGPGDPGPIRPDLGPVRPGPVPDPLDPLQIGPPRRPVGDLDPLGEFGPFGYGDRDRLPFGRGGGGMYFDPRRGGSSPMGPYLPPGHPPGARFDPVSPLRPPIRPPRPPRPGPNPPGAGYYGPNPDHLPPPGYDDMFS